MDEQSEVKSYAEIVVDDWEKAKRLFTRIGPDWIFRGQAEAAWDLKTSFEREIFPAIFQGGMGYAGITVSGPPRYEEDLIKQFQRGAYLYNKGGRLPESLFDWLALMQHYGTPTRLLDFTKSPYVASYFAFKNRNQAEYRAVWALNATTFRIDSESRWDRNDSPRNTVVSNADPAVNLTDTIDNQHTFYPLMVLSAQEGFNAIVPVPGQFADERIMAQQGMFVLPTNLSAGFMLNVRFSMPVDIDPADSRTSPLLKICLPAHLRLTALRDLQLMNITEASLFPGLDGYARSLAPNLDAELYAMVHEARGLETV